MASLLNTLCEPCYTCKLKINGKGCSRLVPFSVQTSTYSNVFFFAIYNWIYQIFLTSEPKENWKKKKRKKKKNRFAVLFSRSSKRAITDQICSELEEIWLSILLGFRKHVRYVACMRAWTVEKEAQPRHWERLFGNKKKKYVLIFAFWTEKRRNKND